MSLIINKVIGSIHVQPKDKPSNNGVRNVHNNLVRSSADSGTGLAENMALNWAPSFVLWPRISMFKTIWKIISTAQNYTEMATLSTEDNNDRDVNIFDLYFIQNTKF